MKMMYSLFDTLLEPVFVINVGLKVVYCNEPAAILIGQSVRKICRDQNFTSLIEFSEPLEALKRIDLITDATPYRELTFKTETVPDGKAQITLQPIFDAIGDKNWILFMRDVTLEERLQQKYRAELSQKEGVIEKLKTAQDQLQEYNKNLEKMVADRTAELTEMNTTLGALLDSLGQGFFIFDKEGTIAPIYSKACLSILEAQPAGQKIWDTFKIPKQKTESFQKWIMTVFEEMLPFEDLAPLGPNKIEHLKDKHIALEYHPIRNQEQKIVGVVVVASDITSLVAAQEQAQSQKEHALLIVNLIKSKREVQRFIEEATLSINFIRSQMDQDLVTQPEELYRHLHTLKGGSAIFSAQEFSNCCHDAETLLGEYQTNSSKPNFVALRAKTLEVSDAFQDFLSQTQEILGKNIASTERQIEVALSRLNQLARKMGAIPGTGFLAQQLVLELAMEPAHQLLSAYNDSIQILAQKLGKDISPLKIKNGDIMLMPEVYNKLFSTLVHAFRNAVDHGIEISDIRRKSNKPDKGQIQAILEIKESLDQKILSIVISDDGAGINPTDLREKLKSKKIDVTKKSDQEVLQHIFDSEFSTRTAVNEYSGRGIGMSAIRSAAENLNGKIWVESIVGSGTQIKIEVPYYTEFENKKSDLATADHKKAA